MRATPRTQKDVRGSARRIIGGEILCRRRRRASSPTSRIAGVFRIGDQTARTQQARPAVTPSEAACPDSLTCSPAQRPLEHGSEPKVLIRKTPLLALLLLRHRAHDLISILTQPGGGFECVREPCSWCYSCRPCWQARPPPRRRSVSR